MIVAASVYIYHLKFILLRKTLSALLLLSALTSFAGDREPYIDKGTFTAGIGYGFPNMNGWSHSPVSIGAIIVAGDYQLSKRFNIGLQYNYNYTESGMRNYFSTIDKATIQYFSNERWNILSVNSEYCYLNRGKLCLGSGLGLGAGLANGNSGSNTAKDPSIKEYNYRYTVIYIMLRLVDVQVKIKDNLSATGCLGFGSDGMVTAGLQYTFRRRN